MRTRVFGLRFPKPEFHHVLPAISPSVEPADPDAVLAEQAPENQHQRDTVRCAANRKDPIRKPLREEDVRHGASRRTQTLREDCQRTRPPGRRQDHALYKDEPNSDPRPGCDGVGDSTEQGVENARAEDPEDESVDDLDVEDREFHAVRLISGSARK